MSKLCRRALTVSLWVSLLLLVHTPAGVAQTLGKLEHGAKFGGTYRRTLVTNPATLDSAFDDAQRMALYRQAEHLVMDNAPWIPQHNQVFEQLSQPYVQGIDLSLLGDRWILMHKIWLKKSPVEGSQEVTPNVHPSR